MVQHQAGKIAQRSRSAAKFDNLDEAVKEEALIAIFPALKPFDVKWTLKKWQRECKSGH